MSGTGSLLRALECRACEATYPTSGLMSTCPTCGKALFAVYDLDRLDGPAWVRGWSGRPATLWRYRELLPVANSEAVTTLGEGFTPILALGVVEGVELSLKDDGTMPTGSFKARGMAVAVSRARELGARSLYVPSAGNAGVALAAYAARASLAARVYLPERTPGPMKSAVRLFGAEVVEVPGTIREAGEQARTREKGQPSFDMSTLREPFRAEGKKTMGLEIFEQCAPTGMPDAIVYPTGGGTGLIGMARAFVELEHLGLLERSPRLYAVQSEGCAPIVHALEEGATVAAPVAAPASVAPGLLVPSPFSSEQVLRAVRASRGGGVTVTDRGIVAAMRSLATRYGISASPEGAAPFAALPRLLERHQIAPGERVLLYNTGSGIPFSWDDLARSVE